jgi:hypothetical protein
MFAMIQDAEEIIAKGLFQGFSVFVIIILLLQAATGLVRYHLFICDYTVVTASLSWPGVGVGGEVLG